ncbi:MAG TPA: C4-type zinc ribbon domain-containing protein [Terriglobia bacterium]|nr:C4-type zinc ribbon domain-containing protein [Terriglobia bacterium]
MSPELQNLMELQRLDDLIRALEAEIAGLPGRIAAIESTLTSHIQQVEADKHALAENQKLRRRREQEIAAARDKIAHYKDQSLQVKTNEQYRAMLHEIEHQESLIRQIEDQILAEMMDSESLERKLQESEKKLAEERKQAQAEIEAARQRKGEDEQKLVQARAERSRIQQQVAADLYETYERVARARNGEAVVAVIDGACSACHVRLRPQVFSELMSNQQLRTCESCGRILYYDARERSGEAAALRAGAAS